MRIGINAQIVSDSGAGVPTYANYLIRNLLSENKDHEFFIFGSDKFLKQLDSNRARLVSTSQTIQKSWNRILWEQFVLPAKAKHFNIDMMFYPDHSASLFKKNCRIIITIHDLAFIAVPETFPAGKRLYKSLAVKHSVNQADKIIAVSNTTKLECVRLLKVPEEKIKVIYNGIDERFKKENNVDILSMARNKYGIKKKYILFVGTLEPRKNIVQLIRAFGRLRDTKKIDHQLVIAGKKGWLYSHIFKEVERLKLKDDVRFLNYVEHTDLVAIYSMADVFVYPSLYEGFGFPPLEAMACEVPVVSSSTNSLLEVLGDAAQFTDCNRLDEFANVILTLLTDSDLRRRLIARGIERVKQFSWINSARSLLSIFDEIR